MTEQKPTPDPEQTKKPDDEKEKPKEISGYENKAEPTRYGDWESNGRCTDF